MTFGSHAISDRVLVDTSAFFALISTSDAHHRQAVEASKQMRRQPFTTNFVVAETHALCLRRLGRSAALRFLSDVNDRSATIVRVSEEDEHRALEIIVSRAEKDYSLTDATSFAVMERLGIPTAFTFDRHFAQFGFVVLGLDSGQP